MSVPSVVVELVRVVVLADDPVSRSGVVAGLREARTLHVVPDREAARSDVVVCVADDPTRAALLVRQVLSSGARRAVAVVGALDDAALLALVEAGACGLLRRSDATPEALAEAVRTADAGDGALPPDLLGRLLGHVQRLGREVLAPRGLTSGGLTHRERQVLELLADGEDTHGIARQLAYSERTVKNVVHDLTMRLGVRNRTQAVAQALRHGLIS
ncbi:MAG: transcriptional regulator, LuxR family [Frankiales bacterium]|nr:transcriptional regulator, LuxR family [Frankiales bacterium]